MECNKDGGKWWNVIEMKGSEWNVTEIQGSDGL